MINPIYKLIALKTRKDWAKNDKKRDEGLKIPENLEIFDNISYGKHKKSNLLCIYKPKNSKNLPCIINFHGGGFFYGDKELYSFYSADLARRGFIVICFNYRLAPENIYPSQIEDINNLMIWLNKNAAKYDISKDKIFFVGDSAGANLVVNYTAALTNPFYANQYKFKIQNQIKPKAVALNCGLYDFGLEKEESVNLLYKAYLGKNRKKYANLVKVMNFITKDFPKTFISSAPNDPLLCQVKPMADVLKKNEVPVITKIYGTKEDSNTTHVFQLNLRLEIAKNCNDDECEFFNK